MSKLPSTAQTERLINQAAGKGSHTTVSGSGWDWYVGQLEVIEREKPWVKVGVHDDAGLHTFTEHRKGKQINFMGPVRRKSFKMRSYPHVAQVAFWNEFGTRFIPERSFIRSTIDENLEKYQKVVERLMALTFLGNMDVYQSLGVFGLKIESDIKRKITMIRIPPNAPSTIRRKWSSNPLIDSGQMRASIRFVIGKGES